MGKEKSVSKASVFNILGWLSLSLACFEMAICYYQGIKFDSDAFVWVFALWMGEHFQKEVDSLKEYK